jgi:hypothetical protein
MAELSKDQIVKALLERHGQTYRCSRRTRTGTAPASGRLVSSTGTYSSSPASTRARPRGPARPAAPAPPARPDSVPARRAATGIPTVASTRLPLVNAWLA